MLGDPKAETLFNIEFTGGQVVLTPNTHYLSTMASGSPHAGAKSKKSSKKMKKPKSVALPGLCVVSCGLTLNLVLPMYSGNATPEIPQRTQVKAKLSDVQSGTTSLQKLGDAQKCVPVSKGDDINGNFKQFLHVPCVEFSFHMKRQGEEGKEKEGGVYFQLDIEKVVSSLSHTHVSKLLFVGGTWAAKESHASSADIECPAHPGSKLGHLHLSVLNTSLSYTGADYYSLSSAVVSEVSVAMVKDAGARKLGCLLPVVYGPINTQEWNSVSRYVRPCPTPPLTTPPERLIEFFIARPYHSVKGV